MRDCLINTNLVLKLLVFCIAPLGVGCIEKESLIITETLVQDNDDIDIHSEAFQEGLTNAIKKAEQMAYVRWTPVSSISWSTIYSKGKESKGIPYSSAKETDKFVGQEVSFYTFLTAVSNPRSVLYTDNISQPPYNGHNCSYYYGTVCSMSVNYALGINAPFASNSYQKQSFMKKISDNDIDKLEAGDVLASNGHTIMVTEVKRHEGLVDEIKYFENSHFVTEDRNTFFDSWKYHKYIQYRYRDMASNKFEPIEYPMTSTPQICANRGDKSVYRTDETVVINILTDGFTNILLYRDDVLIDNREIFSMDQQYDGLKEGMYSACLTDGTERSGFSYFEVRDVEVTARFLGDKVVMYFDNLSIPATGAELCDLAGEHLFTKLVSDGENKSHRLVMDKVENEEPYYCKIIFQGKYGKIASKRIRVE